jgi:hypothetical protein
MYGRDFYPKGFFTAFSMVGSKRATFNGGVELGFGWYGIGDALPFKKYNMPDPDLYLLQLQKIDVNFILQKRFFQHLMAFNFRFGIGIGNLLMVKDNSVPINDITIQANFGVSYMLLFYKYLYGEIGGDYRYILGGNDSHVLQPRLGIGLQF